MVKPPDPLRLRCACGGESFVVVTFLRWAAGKGLHPEPQGYECRACTEVVDAARLIRMAEVRTKQAEVAQATAELADLSGG